MCCSCFVCVEVVISYVKTYFLFLHLVGASLPILLFHHTS